jgi:hypothetical protein
MQADPGTRLDLRLLVKNDHITSRTLKDLHGMRPFRSQHKFSLLVLLCCAVLCCKARAWYLPSQLALERQASADRHGDDELARRSSLGSPPSHYYYLRHNGCQT